MSVVSHIILRPDNDALGKRIFGDQWPAKKQEMMTMCPVGPIGLMFYGKVVKPGAKQP